eukprot:jgi/Astpho2/7922/Aster-06400
MWRLALVHWMNLWASTGVHLRGKVEHRAGRNLSRSLAAVPQGAPTCQHQSVSIPCLYLPTHIRPRVCWLASQHRRQLLRPVLLPAHDQWFPPAQAPTQASEQHAAAHAHGMVPLPVASREDVGSGQLQLSASRLLVPARPSEQQRWRPPLSFRSCPTWASVPAQSWATTPVRAAQAPWYLYSIMGAVALHPFACKGSWVLNGCACILGVHA